MTISEDARRLYKQIIYELSPTDGSVTSSATLVEAIDEESSAIQQAVRDLIGFGELEFVNVSGSGGHARVRLHEPVTKETTQTVLDEIPQEPVWKAYIVDADRPRQIHGQRLFSEKNAAVEHLEMLANATDLKPVPGLENVWFEYDEWDSEYAVLRKEPIFDQADSPYP